MRVKEAYLTANKIRSNVYSQKSRNVIDTRTERLNRDLRNAKRAAPSKHPTVYFRSVHLSVHPPAHTRVTTKRTLSPCKDNGVIRVCSQCRARDHARNSRLALCVVCGFHSSCKNPSVADFPCGFPSWVKCANPCRRLCEHECKLIDLCSLFNFFFRL